MWGWSVCSAEGLWVWAPPPDDGIWGLFPADGLSPKVWSDANKLVKQYGFGFDIIYDETGVVDAARNRYDKVFLWNEALPFS